MVEAKREMDIVHLFCDVDDFCKSFEPFWKKQLLPGLRQKVAKK